MVRRFLPTLFVVMCIAITITSSAWAHRSIWVGEKKMSLDSEVIVHAVVIDQKIQWNSYQTRILTLTELRVIDAIKGARAGDRLTVYQVGGNLDNVTFKIPGAIRLKQGEELVFFGVRFKNYVVSYGLGLGKYQVINFNNTLRVVPEVDLGALVQQQDNGRWVPVNPVILKSETLDAFKQRIHQWVAGASGGAQ